MVQLAWSICTLECEGIKRQSYIVRADDFDPNPTGKLSHRIDKARSLKEGIPADSILREFIGDALSHGVRYLVAHNVEFDEKVLIAESRRTGVDLTPILALPKLCTMQASTRLLKLARPDTDRRLKAYRANHNMRTRRAKRGYAYYQQVLSDRPPKYPTLRELHVALFGQLNSDWHNALADVEACERCFRIVAKEKIEEHACALIERQRYEAERAVRREKARIEAETRKAEMERVQKVGGENSANRNFGTVVGAFVELAFRGSLGAAVSGVVRRALGVLFGKK